MGGKTSKKKKKPRETQESRPWKNLTLLEPLRCIHVFQLCSIFSGAALLEEKDEVVRAPRRVLQKLNFLCGVKFVKQPQTNSWRKIFN
jgi:hypothetical protein